MKSKIEGFFLSDKNQENKVAYEQLTGIIKESYLDNYKCNNIYLEFKKEDFIYLRTLSSGNNKLFSLAFHIESCYIFMIKEDDNYDKENEINFCKSYSHRCMVHFYGFLKKQQKIIGFVYEFMCNNSLFTYVSNNAKHINEICALMIINRIYQGIDYLHSNNLIHRDISPSNILFDHDNLPYISDFETMRSADDTSEMTLNFGNSLYLSPEQNLGKQISYKTDIYSFGILIFFIINKKNAKGETKLNELSIELPSMTNLWDMFEDVYEMCTFSEPEDRPTNEDIKNLIIFEVNSLVYLKDYFNEFSTKINRQLTVQFIHESIMIQKDSLECPSNVFLYRFLYLSFVRPNIDLTPLLNLAKLYMKGIYVKQNQIKARQIYEFVANLKNTRALVELGNIYYHGIGGIQNFSKAKKYYESAANENNLTAIISLGNMYRDGKDGPQDFVKARKYYELASKENDPIANFNLGFFYEKGLGVDQNYLKSKEYYELSAKMKYSDAFLNLGNLYFQGYGVERDYITAIKYYELSAELNNPSGLVFLGKIYLYGYGVKQEYDVSRHYFEKAAMLNDISAIFILGCFYFFGFGVKKDHSKAKQFFEIGAKQNHSDSILFLGICYYAGYGVETDQSKSKYYLELVYDKQPIACLFLGHMYQYGFGVKRDITNAIKYYDIAAKQNNSNALINLGRIYESDIEVTRDYSKAKHYFEMAAELDNSEAFFCLGNMYYYGHGIETNYLKAKEYLEISAKKLNPNALLLLGDLYFNGNGVKKDFVKAKDYYELSANQNNSDAYVKLGSLYYKGLGVEQNYQKAIKYYELSAQLYNATALFYLGEIYLNGEVVKSDILKGIMNLTKCYQLKDDLELFNNTSENLIAFNYRYNKLQYRAINDIGLIFLLNLNNVEYASEFVKIAALSEYPFGQNNFGLFNQFFLNKIEDAEYMYKRASEHNFALAEYNLGYFYEKNNKDKESIEYYIKASNHENEPLMHHNYKHNDKRLVISKIFVICYTNLKLFYYYFMQPNYEEAKKYFSKVFQKLNSKDDVSYPFHFQYDQNITKNSFSYLLSYILNSPLFDLKNQPHLNSDIKSMLDNEIEEIDSIGNYKKKPKEINEVQEKENSLNVKEAIGKHDGSTVTDNVANILKNKSFLDEFKKQYNFNGNAQANLAEDRIIFESPDVLIDFIIKNKKTQAIFIDEIRKIMNLMKNILYTPPYSILFGRISIEKTKTNIKARQKSINELFYEGFGIEI
ncbi:hypothetical protein M9Y10_015382 [Tritrichomonas musculus]|uniref:Protein kinase domain-containing protein n=1 Tax=Tritrichomonas musculus TaxID=1915356 RepID=A0ABR2L253_9EUKA